MDRAFGYGRVQKLFRMTNDNTLEGMTIGLGHLSDDTQTNTGLYTIDATI